MIFWFIAFAILIIYFIAKYFIKRTKSWKYWKQTDKIIQAFLLAYCLIGMFSYNINPIIETTEYAKSNLKGEIKLEHNIIKVLNVRETTNLIMPVQDKNYSFSKNVITLKTHEPKNEKEAENYIYEVKYKHRRFF